MAEIDRLEVVNLDAYEFNSPHQCVITFDDAYEDVYHHAFPLLKARGLPFEIFVNGGFIGGWNDFDANEPYARFCSLDHLKIMADNGGRIQWHTATHRNLAKLDAAKVQKEMAVPAWLRKHFPRPHLTWLAYPYGSHTPPVLDAARQLFNGGVSVDAGSNADRYQLNRITVRNDASLMRGNEQCAAKSMQRDDRSTAI